MVSFHCSRSVLASPNPACFVPIPSQFHFCLLFFLYNNNNKSPTRSILLAIISCLSLFPALTNCNWLVLCSLVFINCKKAEVWDAIMEQINFIDSILVEYQMICCTEFVRSVILDQHIQEKIMFSTSTTLSSFEEKTSFQQCKNLISCFFFYPNVIYKTTEEKVAS